jgi:hypothetical protein
MIYNSAGQCVYQGQVEKGVPVKVSFLPPGIYYLRLMKNDQSIKSIPFAKE